MDKLKLKNGIGKAWSQYSFIIVMFIVMIVYAIAISANGNSFKWSHVAAILGSQNTCIVGTMALGMALVIITGQIDLSIGSSLVLTTSATIVAFNMTNSILVMILTAIIVGGLCGLINGLLVGFDDCFNSGLWRCLADYALGTDCRSFADGRRRQHHWAFDQHDHDLF